MRNEESKDTNNDKNNYFNKNDENDIEIINADQAENNIENANS